MIGTSRKSRAGRKPQQTKGKKQERLSPNATESKRGRTEKAGLLTTREAAIAERKRAEQALQASELSYRRLFEAAKDGILILDAATGEITDVNPFLSELLGYSRAELLGRHLWELGFFRDIARNQDEFRELQAKGYVRYEDLPLEKRNGERAYVEFVSNVYDVSGRQIIQCNIRDITARKQAEQVLRETEKRFRALVENSSDAITLLDAQGKVLYDSPSAPGLLGYGDKDWIGQQVFALIHPEDLPKIRGILHNISQTPGARAETTFRLHHKSGAWLWIEAVATNLLTEPGVQAIVVNYRDVTAHRQAEDALKRSENEYRHLFDKANDVILIFEPEQEIILEANGAACAAYGFDHDELVGMSLRALTRNVEAGAAHVKGFLEGRLPNNFESVHFNKAGEDIHFLINCSLIEYRGKKAILSINRDITDRKRMEFLQDAVYRIASAALATGSLDDLYAEIHRIISGVMDAQNFYITIYDAERDLLTFPYFKDAADAGYMNEARPEKGLTAYVLRTGKSLLCTQAVHDELERRGEVKLLGAPSSIWLGVPLIVQGKAIGAMVVQNYSNPAAYTEREQHMLEFVSAQVAVAIDRKRAEQALRERETRYRALFEDSPVSLWEEDFSAVKRRLDALRQGGITNFEEYFAAHPEVVSECVALVKVLDVNKATMALQRANRKEDLLNGIAEALEGVALQSFAEELVRIAEGATSFNWNGLNRTPDGRLIDVSVNWSAAPGYEESLARVMVSMLDITERKRAEEALRQSKERFQRYFELGLIGMAITSATKGVLEVNDQLCTILGYGRDELLGMTWAEITHPDDLDADVAQFNRVAAGEIDGYSLEKRWIRKDGRVIDSSMSVKCVRFADGSIDYFVALVQDVTERKRAEAERQALSGIMQAAALISNLQGFLGVIRESLARVLYAENFFVIFRNPDSGLFEEVFSVDKYDETMPPSSLTKSITSYVFRTGEPLLLTDAKFADLMARGEVELVGRNSASWLGAPLKTPAGTIGVIAVQNYEDVNCYSERDKVFLASVGAQVALAIERRQAEEKLEEERILLRTLIDSLPDRVYVMDQQGRTIVANTADWQAAGAKTMEEVIGKTDLETYPPELAEQYWSVNQTVINSGTAVLNHEEQATDPNGNPTWLLTSKVPLRDAKGNIRGLVGVGRDITERKRAEARIERQVHRLAALRAIDAAISSSFDLRLSLNILLAQSINELGVDAGVVLVLNKFSNELEYAAGVGFRGGGFTGLRLKLGEGLAGQAVLERRTVSVPNLAEVTQPFSRPRLMGLMAEEEFAAFFVVPLVAKGEVKGVMEVFSRTRLDPEPEWLDFLETLAGQAAIAIDSAQTFSELERSSMELALAYDATIEGWSRAMDLRDKETEGHTQRVTATAVKLGRAMGLPEPALTQVRRGSLLHDIGKMGVPDAILLKPGPLTEEEWVLMKKHPTLAYEMLAPIRYLQPAIDIPYCHHEKWDGSGYPRGLKGEQIPLAARMFAVVDVFDALTSDRPYRAAWSTEKVREYLLEQAGTHFDPQIVELFLKEVPEVE